MGKGSRGCRKCIIREEYKEVYSSNNCGGEESGQRKEKTKAF